MTEKLEEKTPVEKKKDEYPAAKIILSVLQKENDLETDRKKTFDTRASTFVAFSGALIAFFTKNIDLSFFGKVVPANFFAYSLLVVVFFIAPIVFLGLAIYKFVNVLDAKEYKRLPLAGFAGDNFKKTEDEMAMHIADVYKIVILHNSNQNDNKAKEFKKGVLFLMISLGLMFMMYILSFAIKID